MALFEDSNISDQDQQSYFEVINRAYAVYEDREKVRDGLWKKAPSEDHFNQVRMKCERILAMLSRPDHERLAADIQEEADDIINYVVFGVRCL